MDSRLRGNDKTNHGNDNDVAGYIVERVEWNADSNSALYEQVDTVVETSFSDTAGHIPVVGLVYSYQVKALTTRF